MIQLALDIIAFIFLAGLFFNFIAWLFNDKKAMYTEEELAELEKIANFHP